MLSKVVLPLAAVSWLWSSNANPSVDCTVENAPAAVEEYVVLLQRSLDMQDASVSEVTTDDSQELRQKQEDTVASGAAADTSHRNEHKKEEQQLLQQRQRQQQKQNQQHNNDAGAAEVSILSAKTELADATSGAHRVKEEVFPSLPPPEEQDRDYIRDESDAETMARRKREEAAQRVAQEAAQQAAKQATEKDDKQATDPAPAPAPPPIPVAAPMPEPRLSPEDSDYVKDQDYVHTVPVGMVLNMNDKIQRDTQEFRQAEQKAGSSVVERMRLELDLERARQEAEAAQRAVAGQKGVAEAAEAQEAAFAGTAQKAAELHSMAEQVYLNALNGSYEVKDEDNKKASAEEKGTKARAKVMGKVAKAAKWIIGSNETSKRKDRSKDPEVLQLHSLVLEAEALEERVNKLADDLKRSKMVAEAKVVNMTSAEQAKRGSEDKARFEVLAAAAKADVTIAATNQIASGALEEAEKFFMRLVADTKAGDLRAAAGPGSKLAMVPLLILVVSLVTETGM